MVFTIAINTKHVAVIVLLCKRVTLNQSQNLNVTTLLQHYLFNVAMLLTLTL